MQIRLNYIGGDGVSPASIIELIIETGTVKINEDITDLNGKVDIDFINNLQNIANDLLDQNRLISEKLAT